MQATTVKELIEGLGRSRATVARYRRDPKFPGGKDGPWDIAKCLAWSETNRSKKASRAPAPGTATAAAQDRYRDVKTAKEEILLARLRGELVERAKVEGMLVTRAQEFRKALQGLPRKLASKVKGKDVREIQVIIDEEIARILANFVRRRGLEDLT